MPKKRNLDEPSDVESEENSKNESSSSSSESEDDVDVESYSSDDKKKKTKAKKGKKTIKKKAVATKKKKESPKKKAEPIEVASKPPSIPSDGVMTYMEMIREAMERFEGRATSTEICKYIEKTYPEQVKQKTKTWRNSISGQLSTHFEKDPSSTRGNTIWINKELVDKPTYRRAVDENGEPIVKKRKPDDLEDDDADFAGPVTKKPKSMVRVPTLPKKPKPYKLNVDRLDDLRDMHPQLPMKDAAISYINKKNPLKVSQKLSHAGSVYRLRLSNRGSILASCSSIGTIKLWDAVDDFKLLLEFRDTSETNIEEFYNICFSLDDRYIIAAGKQKDRTRWAESEEDNEVLSGTIKIFETSTGNLVLKLEGHEEEVLDFQLVEFEGDTYILSVGQDGKIIKWRVAKNFSKLEDAVEFPNPEESKTSIAASLDFVPNCGKKFFLVACDTGIKIFDFETEQLVQSFPNLYGYLCDCVEFVDPLEFKNEADTYYVITRGVEPLNEDEKGRNYIEKPNAVHLRKLVMDVENRKTPFDLETVNTFENDSYNSNLWLLKLSSNGRYVLCSTTDGKIFVWNMKTKAVTAVIPNENSEVDYPIRDIVFHPKKRLMMAAGDSSTIYVYQQDSDDNVEMQDVAAEEEEEEEEDRSEDEEEDVEIDD